MNYYAMISSFLGTAVEFVEALTIVLAVGTVRGWKSSLSGMAAALLVLAVMVIFFGVPLMKLMDLSYFQVTVGILMMMFGMRWLRKAILRYSGLKALHLEDQAYEEELSRQKRHGKSGEKMDWFGFATSFNIVLVEGIEAVFIVLTVGSALASMESAVAGSLIGVLLVVLAGILLRKPLAMIPENTMKFMVGIMIGGFGLFWVGEGIGVEWWHEDLSILIITLVLLVVSYVSVKFLSVKTST